MLRKIYELVIGEGCNKDDAEFIVNDRDELIEFGTRRHGIALDFNIPESEIGDVDNGESHLRESNSVFNILFGHDIPSLGSSSLSRSLRSSKAEIGTGRFGKSLKLSSKPNFSFN